MKQYTFEPGESGVITIQAPDSAYTTLYPETIIRNSSNAVIDTIYPEHVANGLYVWNWTAPTTEGSYYTQTLFYTDEDYLDVSTIISPDSDTILIGYYKSRASFGYSPSGESPAGSSSLSSTDIDKIATSLFDKVKKVLPEKFFDPKKDVVKLEERSLQPLEKLILGRTSMLEQAMVTKGTITDIVKKAQADICKDIAEVKKTVIASSKDDQIIGDIKELETIINNQFTSVKSGTEAIKKSLSTVSEDVKELDSFADTLKGINNLTPEMFQAAVDKYDQINTSINSLQQAAQTSAEGLRDMLVIAARSVSVEEIKRILFEHGQMMEETSDETIKAIGTVGSLVVDKDGLDDQRAKVLLKAINRIVVLREAGADTSSLSNALASIASGQMDMTSKLDQALL